MSIIQKTTPTMLYLVCTYNATGEKTSGTVPVPVDFADLHMLNEQCALVTYSYELAPVQAFLTKAARDR
jgi:hypothetical protein